MRARFYLVVTLFWIGCVLLIMVIPRSSNAAEWSTQPSVRVGWEHNTNPTLTAQPHQSVSGSMVSPELDLGMNTGIWQVTGSAVALQKRYSGESGQDRDDRYYNLMTSYKTERSTWQVAGSASKSSTVADERISADTGVVEVQKIYDSRSINPSWTWAMNELTQLQLAYSFNSISYVDGRSAGLSDYTTRGISAQLTNWFDAKDQVFFSAGYSIFNVPSTTFESKSATYQAGVTRVFSETLRGTISAGARKSSSNQDVVVCSLFFGPFCLQTANATQFSKQSSSVFNGSLDKQYEVTRLSLTVNRSFDPSGLGGEVRTDSQNIVLSRRFTSRLSGNLSAGYYTYKSETGDLGGIDRRYYAFAPFLLWAWTNELSVNLRYDYRHIKRAAEDQPVASNVAFLTLGYQWPKMALSR